MKLVPILLMACFPRFPEDKGATFPENPWHDYDGDGFTEMQGDCNDEEVGNPAPVTYYLDEDNDGFGDITQSHTACVNQMPVDAVYVPDGTDCNDNDASVYPGSSREGAGMCVRDGDGDGYGDSTASAPYDAGSDCNDLDEYTYPGSSQEGGILCIQDLDGDGYGSKAVELPFDIGTDCDDNDGYTYPGSSLDGGTLCVQDLDGDGYGSSAASQNFDIGTDCNDNDAGVFLGRAFFEPLLCVQDLDGDGYGDMLPDVSADAGSDCNDDDASVYPGRNNEPGVICILDSDGDGYGDSDPPAPYDAGSDCDDGAALVSPVAHEFCDEIDNDCDNEIDEMGALGAPSWYVDSDGDGFGSMTAMPMELCGEAPPTGYSAIALDCDDTNALSSPVGVEVCDGIDNNCDGVVDENTMLDFFLDSDGDGYGDPIQSQTGCTAPNGYVSDNTDCDDTNGAQYPGADEYCNSEDDDCDGVSDEVEADGTRPLDALLWYPDSDADGFGNGSSSVTTVWSCTTPSGYVTDNTDCNDGDGGIYPSAPEYCNNIDDDCDLSIDNNPVGTTLFYVDSDGDGDGDATDSDGNGVADNFSYACPVFDASGYAIPPTGLSLSAFDCNDSDANISSLVDELCTDTIDENCDGDNQLMAADAEEWYADSDGDGFGNAAYTIYSCPEYDSSGNPQSPQGYVELQYDSLADPLFDCDDTDGDLWPGNVELCNGKLDDCYEAEDLDGDGVVDYGPRAEEVDNDQDGFIECDYTLDTWTNILTVPTGWGDCQDDDPDVYPGALELCTGEVEDCDAPSYGTIPADESDDDGDGYVECSGFISVGWEGDSGVVGGNDCDDDAINTYPGAAYNYPSANAPDPTFCAADADGDGYPDCVRWSNNTDQLAPLGYSCDLGVYLSNTIGPDFVLISAGVDPTGRYELSNDFYIMTTEVTQAMFEILMGYTNPDFSGDEHPIENITWQEAAEFANALSQETGLAECYNSSNDYNPLPIYSGSLIYTCPGYRLPTEAEWEYAARSGMAVPSGQSAYSANSYIWTADGAGEVTGYHLGPFNPISDGVGNYALEDFAWYRGNNSPIFGTKDVAQLLPNGFGLYDMHGNVEEITNDWVNNSAGSIQNHIFPYGTGTVPVNPAGILAGDKKIVRGGNYESTTTRVGVTKFTGFYVNHSYALHNTAGEIGMRLVRTANP